MSALQWVWQAAHHCFGATSVDLTQQIFAKLLDSLGGTTPLSFGLVLLRLYRPNNLLKVRSTASIELLKPRATVSTGDLSSLVSLGDGFGAFAWLARLAPRARTDPGDCLSSPSR
jgi:hypothetical protein